MYPLLPVSLNCPYLIVLSAFCHLYYPEHILLKCLYQARKIGCHVYIYIYIMFVCIRYFELASISASWLLIQCHVVYSEKKDIMKLFVEETGVPAKTTDLPQFTDKHNVVSSTPRPERDSNSQL